VRRTEPGLDLVIRDDGRGFEPQASNPRSFGLLGMRERALALGGQLTIESSRGRGTTVRLRVPARSLDVGRTPTGRASRVPTRDLGAA